MQNPVRITVYENYYRNYYINQGLFVFGYKKYSFNPLEEPRETERMCDLFNTERIVISCRVVTKEIDVPSKVYPN